MNERMMNAAVYRCRYDGDTSERYGSRHRSQRAHQVYYRSRRSGQLRNRSEQRQHIRLAQLPAGGGPSTDILQHHGALYSGTSAD